MSRAGWYPDPGGAPGMYRYWDGARWSETVTAQPDAEATPGGVAGGAPDPSRPLSAWGNRVATAPGAPATGRRRVGLKGAGWLLLVLAVVAALVVGGLQLLRSTGLDPFNPPAASNPTVNPCPPQSSTTPSPQAVPNDGRVHGGKLSYPMLGSPWSLPEGDTRLPFGRDVSVQQVMVEPNYDGAGDSWVASILVGELVAGDGFFSPKDGAELIAECAMARFYGDAIVQRNDVSSSAVTLGGKQGWVIETHLSFDIKGLNVKGETAIFEVVQISDTSSSIYYASIPDSVPELLTTARQVQGELRVDP